MFHKTSNTTMDSVLLRAIQEEKTEAVRALIHRGVGVNVSIGADCGPLHLAVERGHERIVQILLQARADVNARGRSGYTALHLSVFSSQAVVRLLLASGADVNAKDSHGNTVLHYAANLADGFELTKMFIEAGASLYEKNSRGLTALHCAVGKANVTLLKYLILIGADVNAKDTKAQTPLHIAATFNRRDSHADTAEVLLENGADAFGRNERGLVPLQCAKGAKITEVFIKHMKQDSKEEYLSIMEYLKKLDEKISQQLGADGNKDQRVKLELENQELRQNISMLKKNMEQLIKFEVASAGFRSYLKFSKITIIILIILIILTILILLF